MTTEKIQGDGGSSLALDRDNLKDRIARALRTEIVTGRMRPGTTYKMGELADQFGASRTPIREAILELEAKGLVEITRGVGFRVSRPTAEELADILEVRKMLEIPATAAAAGRIGPDERRTAHELLDLLTEAAEQNDLTAYLDRDHDFHQFLIACSGNAKLAAIVGDLRDVQRVPGLTEIADEGNLRERNADHVELLAAIEAAEAHRVEEIITRHLELSQLAVDRA